MGDKEGNGSGDGEWSGFRSQYGDGYGDGGGDGYELILCNGGAGPGNVQGNITDGMAPIGDGTDD